MPAAHFGVRPAGLTPRTRRLQDLPEDGDARCLVLNQEGQTRASVAMARVDSARICVQGEHILIFDRAGRLLDIDTRTCRVKTHCLS